MMRLLYDPEGDVLDVIFDELLHRAEKKAAYELSDGFMLYVTTDSMKPIQLTVVNYWRLAQLPTFNFYGWKKLKAADRTKLLPILDSPAISAFLKLDP
ncbi:MAG: hypothetical protein ACREOI_30170, partial [bacterium]